MIVEDSKRNHIKSVCSQICSYFNIDEQRVYGKDKFSDACLARMYCFYILHHKYNYSISTIGIVFERKRRGIFEVISKGKYLINTQKTYKSMYNEILCQHL